jgi:hypothetical protein
VGRVVVPSLDTVMEKGEVSAANGGGRSPLSGVQRSIYSENEEIESD